MSLFTSRLSLLAALVCCVVEFSPHALGQFTPVTPVLKPAGVRLLSTTPLHEAQGVALDQTVSFLFSGPVLPASVTAQAFTVTIDPPVSLSTSLSLSLDQRTVIVVFAGFLPENSQVSVLADGGILRDTTGVQVDVDGDGAPGGRRHLKFNTGPGVKAPIPTGTALVVGYVYDVNGQPVQGVPVDGFRFPRVEHEPPLPAATAFTDALGRFQYTTVPITGTRQILIDIGGMAGPYSQVLHAPVCWANGCVAVPDSIVQPLSPQIPIQASVGANIADPTGQTSLDFPPGSLQQDSNVGMTVLARAELLRQPMPPTVAGDSVDPITGVGTAIGTFTDVNGVFGEEVNVPVTFRVANRLNLPVGTRVPFGKVDHNTLEWMDLRDLYDGPPPVPDRFLGTVMPGGQWIEVEFTHFCSICSSYCLPFPTPGPSDTPRPENGPGCNAPPSHGGARASDGGSGGRGGGSGGSCAPCGSTVGGASEVSMRDGFLWERVDLPGFRERGGEWGLSLGYASYAAAPTATLFMQVDYASTRPVERTLFEFEIAGVRVAANYGFTSNNQKPIGTWFWDGVDVLGQPLPTGSYPYTAVATSLNANTPISIPAVFGQNDVLFQPGGNYPGLVPLRTPVQSGTIVLVNQRNSPFGAGWVVTDEDRLTFDPDGCVVLTQGNSNWKRYEPQGGQSNVYTSPMGDYATLRFNPATGTFRREFDDGSLHEFDVAGRIKTKTDRYGATTTFTYAGGLLSSMTSPTGYFYAFGYQGGKISSITDSAGRQTLLAVNGSGDLVAITDVTGSTRTFSYDSEHRLSGQAGPRGERTEYLYKNGRITETRSYDVGNGPLLRRRQFSPSFAHGEIGEELAQGRGTIVNPIPPVTSRVNTYVDGEGATTLQESNSREQPIRTTDPLGRVTQSTYDPDGTLASKIWPNGAVTEYDWTADGQLAAVREKASAGAPVYSTVTYQYEPIFKQISQVVDAEGKSTRFFYDALGNLAAVEDHDGHRTEFDYASPLHPQLLTEVELPTGDIARFTYDARGNAATFTDFPDPLGQPAGRTTTWTRDNRGNASAITNALGKSVQVVYDAWDRAISVTDPLLATTLYDYDDTACGCSTNRITKITYPNGATIRYGFDGLDRVVSRTDQLGAVSSLTYNPEGLVTETTDRNGDRVTRTYDIAGQLREYRLPNGETTSFSYDSMGSLVSAEWAEGRLLFTYDFLARLLTETQELVTTLPTGQVVTLAHSVNRTWSKVSSLTSVVADGGAIELQYAYDNQHRLVMVNLPNVALGSWSIMRDALGRIVQRDPAGPDGPTAVQYDLAGQVRSITHMTTPQLELNYSSWDGSGNLSQQAVTNGSTTRTLSYQYDGADQLTRSTVSDALGASNVSVVYTVDAAGRVTQEDGWAYTYDAEGSVTSRSRSAGGISEIFQYDALRRLRSVEHVVLLSGVPTSVMKAEYVYDPLGRRVVRRVNGVVDRSIWLGHQFLAEYDTFDRLDKFYAHGTEVDDLLGVFDVARGTLLSTRSDLVGSVVGVSDSQGVLNLDAGYSDFGELSRPSMLSVTGRVAFAGRQVDVETGLIFMRSRLYDPVRGRFMVEDVLDISGGAGLYTYAQNDPVTNRDPLGTSSAANQYARQAEQRCLQNHAENQRAIAATAALIPRIAPPGRAFAAAYGLPKGFSDFLEESAEFAEGCLVSSADQAAKILETFGRLFEARNPVICRNLYLLNGGRQ